jgi:hypothetical protein
LPLGIEQTVPPTIAERRHRTGVHRFAAGRNCCACNRNNSASMTPPADLSAVIDHLTILDRAWTATVGHSWTQPHVMGGSWRFVAVASGRG